MLHSGSADTIIGGPSVVHPPVDTSFTRRAGIRPPPELRRYFLVVSALVPYKRIDLAIEACRQVGVPLKIVGEGTGAGRGSRRWPGRTWSFSGRRTDEEVRDLYRRRAAVLLPGEEDFGIVPVEAQACGRPVVALGRGGALETVVDGVTGRARATMPRRRRGRRRSIAWQRRGCVRSGGDSRAAPSGSRVSGSCAHSSTEVARARRRPPEAARW